MTESQRVKDYFAGHQIPLSLEWLESCIEWCKENSLPQDYGEKDLQLKVYEQWLLLDLRDVEVMQVIDISKPKLWQLQRIRKDNAAKNVDPDGEFGKRVLQLTLTDGVQEIEAMEFKPISCLNINLTPGIKVLLMGPIMVRQGRLMLESSHIKVIGGEVEEIKVPNAVENVLARALGLKENPNPFVIDESLLNANVDVFKPNVKSVSAIKQPTAQMQEQFEIDEDLLREFETGLEETQSTHCNRKTLPVNGPEEYEIDEELLKEFEANFEENDISSPAKSPDLFDEMEVDEEVFHNIDLDNISNNLRPIEAHRDANVSSPTVRDNFNETNFSQLDAEMNKRPSSTQILSTNPKESPAQSKPNVITIKKLKHLQPNIGKGKFKVKAKFSRVVEKMTLTDNSYHMVISLADTSGDVSVLVHSNLVASFAQLDPESAAGLKEKIMENDDEAKAKLLMVLKNIKERLVDLDGIFEIEITRGEKYPVFINVL
ncbi:recQ-mediated genome instability protein 1-like isoform X2 [Cylas formicarius]|uniref:recQ-mediated genome instability protein 1-like isoform X2 n=1 Tax=Cylas formicarius TaxID=197179 RepID=UPI0029585FF2|nr:recQ-mediated genome instability protein 1-like isoform X2 [Cylas formicarius]